MNDIILFAMGCFVSLIVLSAVGLLLWDAANEPRASLFPNQAPRSRSPRRGRTSPRRLPPMASRPGTLCE